MPMKLLNVGFGNLIAVHRLIGIISPDSAPTRRMVQDARDAGKVIDATAGRKTRAVLFMDSGHLVLSPLQPETLAGRLNDMDSRESAKSSEKERGA